MPNAATRLAAVRSEAAVLWPVAASPVGFFELEGSPSEPAENLFEPAAIPFVRED